MNLLHFFALCPPGVMVKQIPDYQFSHPYFSGHIIFRSKLSKKELTNFLFIVA
jgi:hypothetical protein